MSLLQELNAEKYSNRFSKRVKDGLGTSVANRHFCGGTIFFGYKLINKPIPDKPNKFIKKVVIDEEEARVIRLVFDYHKNGYTKKEIARMLSQAKNRLLPVFFIVFVNLLKQNNASICRLTTYRGVFILFYKR